MTARSVAAPGGANGVDEGSKASVDADIQMKNCANAGFPIRVAWGWSGVHGHAFALIIRTGPISGLGKGMEMKESGHRSGRATGWRALTVIAFGLLAGTAAWAQQQKVVFQVSDPAEGKWNLTLNNAHNVQQLLGKDNVKVEIVVYGPGIGMLKLDSPVATRVAEAVANHVDIVACEQTMKAQKLTKADMLKESGYVPGGVVELMKRQGEGYAYIRP
jgi:uncharacterized protein